jgi:hypothetical protein
MRRWLVYHPVMRRTLAHCFLVLILLSQGLGSAWAASTMAAGSVQLAAQVADLPPCHQPEAAQAMDCCGTSSCQCLMSCGMAAAFALATTAVCYLPITLVGAERASAALQAGFYGPPLRPPLTLQS